MKDIRPPLEQPWYPQDPVELSSSIEDYLNSAEIEYEGSKIYGIIVPHAGHIYSGRVAAYAFNCIKKLTPKLVVIISPSHFIGGADLIISSHQAYNTPLGNVDIETELLEDITQSLNDDYGITTKKVSNDPEHSIEVELPFLQVIFKNFGLIPIMIRTQNLNVSKSLGEVLSEKLPKRDCIIIASSDLSHYYNQKIANKMDKEIIDRIESFNPQSVLEAEQQGVGQACGIGAIAAVLWASKELGAKKAAVLNYATSGDVSGDYDGVVGYVSVALY
jgi:AmmeMemoRadiSam system protein B